MGRGGVGLKGDLKGVIVIKGSGRVVKMFWFSCVAYKLVK